MVVAPIGHSPCGCGQAAMADDVDDDDEREDDSTDIGEEKRARMLRAACRRSVQPDRSFTLPTAHPVGPLLAQEMNKSSDDGRIFVLQRCRDSSLVTGE